MYVPLLDLREQYTSLKARIDAAVTRVLEPQGFILGEEVKSFEHDIESYLEVPYAILRQFHQPAHAHAA